MSGRRKSSVSDSLTGTERALLHRYDLQSGWSKTSTTCCISADPFAEGCMRRAFMSKVFIDDNIEDFVAKFPKNPHMSRQTCFRDVEMQAMAVKWADEFSKAAKQQNLSVCFVSAYVLELVERPRRPCCNIEQPITGRFLKHNNNVGAVRFFNPNDPTEIRAHLVAQAFSHFTYFFSNRTVLICDIQGVGLFWTDPQIHTVSGTGCGEGNLGLTGMRAFLLRHDCNDVCASLNLPVIDPSNFNETIPSAVSGNIQSLLPARAGGNSPPLQHRSSIRSSQAIHVTHQHRHTLSCSQEEHISQSQAAPTTTDDSEITQPPSSEHSYPLTIDVAGMPDNVPTSILPSPERRRSIIALRRLSMGRCTLNDQDEQLMKDILADDGPLI